MFMENKIRDSPPGGIEENIFWPCRCDKIFLIIFWLVSAVLHQTLTDKK